MIWVVEFTSSPSAAACLRVSARASAVSLALVSFSKASQLG
jgi:hypothetical protein